MPVLIVLIHAASCVGLGLLTLKFLKLKNDQRPGETYLIGFALGFGILGWLLFPLGVAGNLESGWLIGLLTFGVGCLFFAKPPAMRLPHLNPMGLGLFAIVLVLAAMDILEGLSPPGDADTLAYHFTAPSQFLRAGQIDFILRPLDGSIPYIVQMTYMPVLALGGEKALTLWVMFSGWVPVALLYVLCRRHLNETWSLAVALVFMSTPVVIYAAGTGQVEMRAAIFVLVALWAASKSLSSNSLSYTIIAGLAVGFYAGTKYIGLLFVLAVGLTLLLQRRWLVHGMVFSLFAIITGFQWYAWNAIHTGDPFFPMLFEYIGRDHLELWTKAYNGYLQKFFTSETPAPRSFLWFLWYPFAATIDSYPVFESKRAGFGPFGLLIFPFVFFGLWRFRDRLRDSPLYSYGLIGLLFYGLWFFTGSSQRARHLLPILPLFLICTAVVAEKISRGSSLRTPLIAVFAVTILLQTGGASLFAKKFLDHLTSGETRDAFLRKNVRSYAAVSWINANLKQSDRILLEERQLQYFFRIPYFYGSPYAQAIINTGNKDKAAGKFFAELKQVHITHVFLRMPVGHSNTKLVKPYRQLEDAGCLTRIKSFHVPRISSRTLDTNQNSVFPIIILKVGKRECLG